MTLRPYKFVIQAVCQQLDDDQEVVGERMTEPVTVFSLEELVRWTEAFPARLAAVNGNHAVAQQSPAVLPRHPDEEFQREA